MQGLIAEQGNKTAIFLLQFIIAWLSIFSRLCLSVLLKGRKGVFIADIFPPVMAQRKAGSFCSCCLLLSLVPATEQFTGAHPLGKGPTEDTLLPHIHCLHLCSAHPARAGPAPEFYFIIPLRLNCHVFTLCFLFCSELGGAFFFLSLSHSLIATTPARGCST